MTSSEHSRIGTVVHGLLHPEEVDRFVSGATETEVDELKAHVDRVRLHLATVEAEAERRSTVDVDLARAAAAALIELLGAATEFEATDRALVRGAVEYYVLGGDVQGDLTDFLGFDDDARVLNAVATAVGRPDLAIEIA